MSRTPLGHDAIVTSGRTTDTAARWRPGWPRSRARSATGCAGGEPRRAGFAAVRSAMSAVRVHRPAAVRVGRPPLGDAHDAARRRHQGRLSVGEQK